MTIIILQPWKTRIAPASYNHRNRGYNRPLTTTENEDRTCPMNLHGTEMYLTQLKTPSLRHVNEKENYRIYVSLTS